jgi:ABC-type glycerol-3-phosphate transport system substrate-binding protein
VVKILRLALLLALLALAACASSVAQPVPTPQLAASPEAVAPLPRQLMLTLWHSWNGRGAQALDTLARNYERSHPDVRITLQARPAASLVRDYSAAVSDGSAPQLLLVRGRYLGDLAEKGLVIPLQDKPIMDSLVDLLPAAVDGVRVAGVVYGVPITYDSLMLFYDRRQLPQPPASLGDLLAWTPGGATTTPERRWGLAYYLSAATTLPYLQAFGGAVFAPNRGMTLDENHRAEARRWLEWLQTLHADERATATDDFGAVDALIQSNRVAAALDWTHRLPDYQRLWGADAVGLAGLPPVEGQQPAPPTLLLADVVCVNTVTGKQQRDAAHDFLRFLVSGQAQELLWTQAGLFPTNQKARLDEPEKDDPANAALRAAANAVAFPHTPADTRAWPLLDEMVRSVLAGSATPTEAWDKASAGLRAQAAHP